MKKLIITTTISTLLCAAGAIYHRLSSNTPALSVATLPQVISKSSIKTVVDLTKSVVEMAQHAPSADELKSFLNEIETVFGSIAVSSGDPEQLAQQLSKLNEAGAKGLEMVVGTLSSPPRSDEAVRQRLHLVDYLGYRLRWDAKAKDEAIRLASLPIEHHTPRRYQAALIAEQAEIIEALARSDWTAATALIAKTTNSHVRRLASSAAYYQLREQGHSQAEAIAEVRSFNSDFHL